MIYKICEWDSYLGEQIERDSTEEESAIIEAQKIDGSKVLVPQSITMRQVRLALFNSDKLWMVEQYIDTLSSPLKEATRIDWDYSIYVERYSKLVLSIGLATELNSDDLDSLFVQAAKL